MVKLSITKLRKVCCWVSWCFFKSVNIWRGYQQERGCLVQFVRLASTLLKDDESDETTIFVQLTLPNTHRLKKITSRLINKRKDITTLPCNLSLIACFLTSMLHEAVWQHMQCLVGFLIKNTPYFLEIFQWEFFENRSRFDRIMAINLGYRFRPTPYTDLNKSTHLHDAFNWLCASASRSLFRTEWLLRNQAG